MNEREMREGMILEEWECWEAQTPGKFGSLNFIVSYFSDIGQSATCSDLSPCGFEPSITQENSP